MSYCMQNIVVAPTAVIMMSMTFGAGNVIYLVFRATHQFQKWNNVSYVAVVIIRCSLCIYAVVIYFAITELLCTNITQVRFNSNRRQKKKYSLLKI